MLRVRVRILFSLGLSAGLLLLADPASALPPTGPLNKDAQKCATTLAKNVQKTASALGKDHLKCIKDGSKNKLDGTVDACADSDPKGKVASGLIKIEADFTKRCIGGAKKGGLKLPGWGPQDPNASKLGAVIVAELFTDLLGDDLDAATIDPKADPNTVPYVPKETSKCQQAVLKDAAKCFDTQMKEFGGCLKGGAKGGKIDLNGEAPFESGVDLDECLGFDPKGKIDKACTDKLTKDISKKCDTPADLDVAVPGCAGAGDLGQCVRDAVDCRVCETLAVSAALGRDCSSCALDPNQPVADGLICTTDQTRFCVVGGVVTGEVCTLAADCPAIPDPNDPGNDLPKTCRSISEFEIRIIQAPTDPNTGEILSITPVTFLASPIDGTIAIDCGAPDPNGRALCSCEFDSIVPFAITGFGFVCLGSSPSPGGVIDCDGGTSGDLDMQHEHAIGTCASPAACDTDCATECGGAGNVFLAACAGYCQFGDNDGLACTSNSECEVSNPGFCAGAEADPNTHAEECQCTCLTTAGSAQASTFTCTQGVKAEIEVALPCDGTDVSVVIINQVPLTTNLADATLSNVDLLEDANNPNVDLVSAQRTGNRLSCAALKRGSISGLSLTGNIVVSDFLVGDTLIPLGFTCR